MSDNQTDFYRPAGNDEAGRIQEVTPLVPIPPPPGGPRGSFADYTQDRHNWVSVVRGEYYPDVLPKARRLYKRTIQQFGNLLQEADTAEHLMLDIAALTDGGVRTQIARVFRKYVCPEAPVEMLKKKKGVNQTVGLFGGIFRPIEQVRAAFEKRPVTDPVLCALLWEYKDRGKKGYALTKQFFSWFRHQFRYLRIIGPEGAGRDVRLAKILPDYLHKRPVDFVIYEGTEILAVGLARYDGDRGGSQESDRIGLYRNCSDEILQYAGRAGLSRLKVIFLNDGPGLLLGTMWDDYASIESRHPGRAMVLTLRMVPERLTDAWLRS